MNSAGESSGRGGGGNRGGRNPSSYRGGGGGAPGRGRGAGGGGGRGRGRGRGSGDRYESSTERDDGANTQLTGGREGPGGRIGGGPGPASGRDGHTQGARPGHLVPVRPTGPTPMSNIAWRMLYVVPPNARPEVGLSGEKIPGPFSPPLRPLSMPDQLTNPGGPPRRPQDVLRKQSEVHAMKQRVQQLLQQATDSPAHGLGNYVGRLSHHNNLLIPVLPRLDS
ncbi:hypothetical protein GGI04_003422 [Coemansia thaxteri]|nr:hypothetical protein GGI04_003422 [Coemansia thaxteri]KAJ2464715.1 hypothetical protein EV174_006768 [Coemansia sp. RSA 2320]KAJ2470029.1 hypothetical protein GGI02_003210 [Coemansia sp. RSA 2322]